MQRRIQHFVEELIAGERYDVEEGVWLFAEGKPCGICTASAEIIASEFRGCIWGFWCAENPSAFIGKVCDGHDFALLANRWLVDYWAHYIAKVSSKPLLDLENPSDCKLARKYYGDPLKWQLTASYELHLTTAGKLDRGDTRDSSRPAQPVLRAIGS